MNGNELLGGSPMPTQLTTEQIQTLNQAERILHDLLPDIDGLEACDFNCQQLRAENERIRQQITKLKTNFGQGVPNIQQQEQVT